jgi:hypothetical protein
MSADVIDFTTGGQEKPALIKTAPSERDEKMAQAFRNLEPEICDCVRMAGIAVQLHVNEDEAATFAIGHVLEMLQRFKQEYYAAYRGDTAAIGRHAIIEEEDGDGDDG